MGGGGKARIVPTVLTRIVATIMYTAILRKVVGKSARDNPVWVILSALFFKEI